jgi:hypothetical protein
MDKHMSQTLILDGGMGRELKRIGAPFQQPEWSALALLEGPHFVEQAHDAFVNAGARVITTNSYAVVPFHIGQQRFEQQGEQLAALAGQLARRSADKAAHKVTVAGSLPPALGSYRPDLFNEADSLAIHRVLIEGWHRMWMSGWPKRKARWPRCAQCARRWANRTSRCGCRSPCRMKMSTTWPACVPVKPSARRWPKPSVWARRPCCSTAASRK